MSASRDQRVFHALSQLIEGILPIDPEEEEVVAEERFDNALAYAKAQLASNDAPAVASDINQASDLIKRKLIRQNPSPDKALKFTNLYSRLLTQPVLSQKWAILYFLYKLSDSDQALDTGLRTERSPSFQSDGIQVSEPAAVPVPQVGDRQFNVDSPAFNDAFAKASLHRPPSKQEARPVRPSLREKRPTQESNKSIRDTDGEVGHKEQRNGEVLGVAPTEAALLRDLPFTLQGLSSTNFQFAPSNTLKFPKTLPVPLISLLHTLAEPSLLYKQLSEWVETSDGGLVGQSMRSAIGNELRSYLGLVATLEGQIRRALAQLDDNLPNQGLGKAGVTLKRCVIWTREATMGLRLMAVMVEGSKGKKGGALISHIHSFSSLYGDPFVCAFAERLLVNVTRPFYDMLRQWIYDGELSDPYLEFFVSEHDDTLADGSEAPRRGGASSVWEEKYKINDTMIPTIINQEFANKVFLIGKSLNFIRYGCGDSTWVENYSKDTSKELRYGDTAQLEVSIDEAYKTTMARLIHLMDKKFKLFEHLQALKKYLLLGQGDFIALLMESLAPNLDRPAVSQYRHMLTAQLEHAVRNSNAQYESADVLRRLDARMLELSHGEIGWDVFTLDYRIDAPVDVVVTPYGSKQYLKVFNFLWRVKRVEFALGSTWRRCQTGARGVLASVSNKVGEDWKAARCVMAEMIHFVCQLQYYILFEVIESSWTELQTAMSKPDATLDDLIHAHDTYLKAITRKGLLGSTNIDFTSQLHELLKDMLAYKDAVDGLYSFSVAEFTRHQELSARVESRTAQGKWGITERDSPFPGDDDSPSTRPGTRGTMRGHRAVQSRDVDSPFTLGGSTGTAAEDDMLPALRSRLQNLGKDFKARINVLLGDLAHQPDPDLKFLAMVMNFNDVYQPVRRKRAGRDKEKGGKPEAKVDGRAERGKEVLRETKGQGSVRVNGTVGEKGKVTPRDGVS